MKMEQSVPKRLHTNSDAGELPRRKHTTKLKLLLGEWGLAPPLLNLGNSYRWMMSLTPRPLYTWGRVPSSLWLGEWVGHRTGLDVWRRESALCRKAAYFWLSFSPVVMIVAYSEFVCLVLWCPYRVYSDSQYIHQTMYVTKYSSCIATVHVLQQRNTIDGLVSPCPRSLSPDGPRCRTCSSLYFPWTVFLTVLLVRYIDWLTDVSNVYIL